MAIKNATTGKADSSAQNNPVEHDWKKDMENGMKYASLIAHINLRLKQNGHEEVKIPRIVPAMTPEEKAIIVPAIQQDETLANGGVLNLGEFADTVNRVVLNAPGKLKSKSSTQISAIAAALADEGVIDYTPSSGPHKPAKISLPAGD